tara:strand:- start:41 stop:424 length:384 start_codon:yes stop_codon:yes gene_type:complete
MVLDLASQVKPCRWFKPLNEDICNMWQKMALRAPVNPQTGRPYHPQTLARCWRGQISNYTLLKWLKKEMHNAKTKERTRNTGRQKRSRSAAKSSNEGITEISEITKAICGEAYSYPTNSSNGKRGKW